MAKRNRRNKKQEDTIVDLVEARGQAQDFFQRNQLMVIAVAAGLAILVGGYLVYHFLYLAPREKQAIEQMYRAEFQFSRDSFALALENPGGGFDGFLDIIDNYGGTKTSNTAKYYAGVSYLNLGRYESAIDYLRDFSAKGTIASITKYGALGDAYSELGELDKAYSNYKKSINAGENELLSPYYLMKLGMLYENQGALDKALEAYSDIKEKYPGSSEGQDIDKYIRRVQS